MNKKHAVSGGVDCLIDLKHEVMLFMVEVEMLMFRAVLVTEVVVLLLKSAVNGYGIVSGNFKH